MNNTPQPPGHLTRREDIAVHRNCHVGSLFQTGDVKQRLGPCLLISRETGAGGSQIARHVAQRLGWKVMDKDIVDILASEYDTPSVVLDTVDEKNVGWIADLLNGWVEGHGFSQLTYVHRLHRLFAKVAQQGNVVIVGRGARFMLPQRETMSVRIIAPLELRVEQVILRQGISAIKSREFIEKSDRQRNAFIKKYFHQNIADPHVHDLVVNVEQLVQEDAVALILDAVRSWLKRRGQDVAPMRASVY